ncbi:hypothetical protein ACPYO6_01360 [Georgenia sp. Z1344]|uniref:hypothetical protein n=1 Tax=Georgenia sp. Z1344 TaxID=3416706 RepID=UPI003CF905CF
MADAINTEVPGDPDQVLDVADWLRKAYQSLEQAFVDLDLNVTRAYESFHGDAGAAYALYAEALREVITESYNRTNEAETEVRVYNTKMRLIQGTMETYRGYASTIGLEVAGFLIHPPPAPRAVPAWNPLDPTYTLAEYGVQMGARAAEEFKVGEYDRLAEAVDGEMVEYLDFIDYQLAPVLTEMNEATGLDELVEVERLGNSKASDALADYVDQQVERHGRHAADWEDKAKTARHRTHDLGLERWDRARYDADEVEAQGHDREAEDARNKQRGWGKVGKAVPVLGIPLTAIDLASTEEDSTVLVESLPWVGPILGPAYEAWVPEHWQARADDLVDNVTDPIFRLFT